MNNKPFIHTFESGNSHFIYDVNTDKILKVDKDVYTYLNNLLENPGCEIKLEPKTEESINTLINYGFLKTSRVKKTLHPGTKYLDYQVKNKLASITLQVTQNCNLRCEYCIYSGGYKNRVHANKKMDIATAKRCVDYLISHSKESNAVNIGFYGGEPLLEFELIKEVVNYSKKVGEGKEIYFNLTTNATLFNEEIVEFFVKNKITVMISLDGDKEIHDKSRVFAISGKGSYDVVVKNINYIKNNYPEYYKEHITFNTVINQENEYERIDDFISKNETFKDSIFLSSIINSNYTDKVRVASEKFITDKKYDRFLTLLSKLDFVNDKNLSPLSELERLALEDFRSEKNIDERSELPEVWHHGGPCIPGVFRLFVTSEGEFLPCEKVSECSKLGTIGSLDTGIDLEKAKEVLNIGQFYEKKCFDCWAYGYCDVCIARVDDTNCEKENIQPSDCDKILYTLENTMKDYCVLKSLGYRY